MISLENFIDIHIHTSPDIRLRKIDDIDAAREAAGEKMKAIVFKSHTGETAARAAIANKVVQGVQVFGSLTLNDYVGGINPTAVEAAINLGAKMVWLPTVSAANHKRYHGLQGGIEIDSSEKGLVARLGEVIELVRDRNIALGTGHISAQEVFYVARLAKTAGFRKLVVTHPEVPWIEMTIAEQIEVRDEGAYFERCLASTKPIGGDVPVERILAAIRRVGVETTLISTDYGADSLETPVEGYRQYIHLLVSSGFDQAQITRMGITNPATLLDIDD